MRTQINVSESRVSADWRVGVYLRASRTFSIQYLCTRTMARYYARNNWDLTKHVTQTDEPKNDLVILPRPRWKRKKRDGRCGERSFSPSWVRYACRWRWRDVQMEVVSQERITLLFKNEKPAGSQSRRDVKQRWRSLQGKTWNTWNVKRKKKILA